MMRAAFLLGLLLLPQLGCCGPAAACAIDLPGELTDYLAEREVLTLLRETQGELLAHYRDEPSLTKTEQETIARFVAATAGDGALPPLPPQRIELRDLEWIDPRTEGTRVEALRSEAIERQCAQFRLLPADACEATERESHNFLTYYLRNVYHACGTPMQWQPEGRDPFIATLFRLAKEGSFAAQHRFHANPSNGQFGYRENFFTLFYLRFLTDSVHRKDVDLAYQEFLGRREDLVRRYPNLRHLRQVLRVLMQVKRL